MLSNSVRACQEEEEGPAKSCVECAGKKTRKNPRANPGGGQIINQTEDLREMRELELEWWKSDC